MEYFAKYISASKYRSLDESYICGKINMALYAYIQGVPMEIVTKHETNSREETFELGRRIGESAAPGSVFTLIGDLGVGKTVLTQGVAAGLGITGPVSSPTFTILQVYDEGRIPFYHFDVYRIGDISEMDEIGYEDYFFGDGICIVEWANLIEELLPEHYTEIVIEKNLEKGYDYRLITMTKH